MSNLDWIYFFSLTTLLNIVAFNLLISLISNTFDRVLLSLSSIQCKIKAGLLIELASFRSRKRTEEQDLKYLFVVRYTSDTIGANASGDEWQGRMQVMLKKVEEIGDKIEYLRGNADAQL